MNYTLKTDKIRNFAHDSAVTPFERELAEEGLRHIAYGSGPISTGVIDGIHQFTITQAMENFLIGLDLISKN